MTAARKQSLMDISDDVFALADLIAECEGDLDNPDVVAALKAFEDEIADDLEHKVDNYSAFIKELEYRSAARKEEARRLSDRARTDENAAKRLKERLKFVFQRIGITKVETPRFKVGIQKNGGVIPVLLAENLNPETLPEPYRKVIYEANVPAIREALEAGGAVPGAALGERGSSLRIR